MRDSRKKVIKIICDRLQSGKSASLLAYNSAISVAIWTATQVKSQLGGVHQLVSTSQTTSQSKILAGIKIVLSLELLDVNDVGYQAGEEKGFWPTKSFKGIQPES